MLSARHPILLATVLTAPPPPHRERRHFPCLPSLAPDQSMTRLRITLGNVQLLSLPSRLRQAELPESGAAWEDARESILPELSNHRIGQSLPHAAGGNAYLSSGTPSDHATSYGTTPSSDSHSLQCGDGPFPSSSSISLALPRHTEWGGPGDGHRSPTGVSSPWKASPHRGACASRIRTVGRAPVVPSILHDKELFPPGAGGHFPERYSGL